MKQRAHAWVALRALKLLDDSEKAPKLVELLSYYLSDAWEGAWIPDTLIGDMHYGHIVKMGDSQTVLGGKVKDKRARVSHSELSQRLNGKRLCLEYVKNFKEFTKPVWSVEGHLPNRVIALSHTAGDMLKIADYPLAFYAKKFKPKKYIGTLTEKNVKDLSLSPNFSARQIALTFFMLSHYICDCHMPLHCDVRDYSLEKIGRRIPSKLHPDIEKKWETQFPKKDILSLDSQQTMSVSEVVSQLSKSSIIKIDSEIKYHLSEQIPLLEADEWSEMINVARVSFIVARKWIQKGYHNVKELIEDIGQEEFNQVTNYIFHDAVQNVAMIWYKAWQRYVGK